MVSISAELTGNYEAFSGKLPKTLEENVASLRGDPKLVESYARVAVLNAVKADLVDNHFPFGAAQFFFEAHNDALLSHVNASFGSWRPALQSMRSFMENTLAAVYYRDHPIEFEKWELGDFKISPRELREYAIEHPKVAKVAKEIDLKVLLDDEYSTLSKAVHGSNSLFRMTSSDGKTNIASASKPDLGKWSARERATVDICGVVLVSVLHDHLEGAKLHSLRKLLGIALKKNSRNALKKHLKVNIPDP